MSGHPSGTTPMVLKLQADAMRPDIPVASLLRTAKAVATKLNLEDAHVWIDLELNGYGDVPVPAYRRLTGSPKGLNPYRGWQPLLCPDEDIMKVMSTAPLGQPLGVIEEMLREPGEGVFYFPYPHEMKSALMNAMDFPTDIHLRIDKGSIYSVVEAVRNLILNWTLELEKEGIIGDKLTFSAAEKEQAAPITQQFFAQNIGHVGNVFDKSNVTNVQSITLHPDDVRKLLKQIQDEMSLLPDMTQDQLTPVVSELKQELQATSPDEPKMRMLLGSLRTICEGATGSIVAQAIITGLTKLLGG